MDILKQQQEKALSNHYKLLNYMGIEKTNRYLSQFNVFADENTNPLEDCYIYSQYGLDLRCLIHFKEAYTIIDVLKKDFETHQQLTLNWVASELGWALNAEEANRYHLNGNFQFYVERLFYDEKDNQIKYKRERIYTNRVEMIDRLEWISSMNFGHNIHKWVKWRDIRSKDRFIALNLEMFGLEE